MFKEMKEKDMLIINGGKKESIFDSITYQYCKKVFCDLGSNMGDYFMNSLQSSRSCSRVQTRGGGGAAYDATHYVRDFNSYKS